MAWKTTYEFYLVKGRSGDFFAVWHYTYRYLLLTAIVFSKLLLAVSL